MGLVWWRLEMAAPAELEESLLWKLPLLGVPRVALQHPPEAPERRQLLAWLPESDWPADQRQELERALAPLGEPSTWRCRPSTGSARPMRTGA